MKKKEKMITKKRLVNAGIAGALVFFGAFIDGVITWKILCGAFAAAAIIFLTQIRDSISSSKQLNIFNIM